MTQKKVELTPVFQLLRILWKYRKPLLISNAIVAVLALIVSLLLPQWYEGRTVFIINEDQVGGLASSMLESAVPFGLLGGIGNDLSDRYINYLGSHTIIDKIDSLYHLQEVYESKFRKKFYDDVKANATFVDNGDNTITIKFYYEEDPEKAAAIANSFYVELDKLVTRLAKENHRNLRFFLERSYSSTLAQLTAYEDSLREFQVKNQLYTVDKQLELLVRNMADIEAEKFSLKIQKEYLDKIGGNRTAEYRGLTKKIESFDNFLSSIKSDADELNIPLEQFPEKGLQFVRLLREVKIREKILEFLIPQLENVRFEEQRAASNLQLLDKAVPQDYKAKPKRIAVIFVTSFFFGVLSLLFFVLREAYLLNSDKIRRVTSEETL